ncbi:MAG: phosphoenolpyruvate synthase [Trueperaceae bacterium]
MSAYVRSFESLTSQDVDQVGGKNASLGEMISSLSQAGVAVPGGFATTALAYREFLAQDGLDCRIEGALAGLDVDDLTALSATGARIRGWLLDTPLPPRLEAEIRESYRELEGESHDLSVAVRSSATAEDLPDASFAGQQETFLNVRGIERVLRAVREVYASLFNDRAIAYRVHKGFAHDGLALSAGIQRMVRSDLGASGVVFTLDTESGFRDVVFITSSYGLGELLVQGAVNPDEFYVHKPGLAQGRPAVLRRSLGSKAQKMVYANGPLGSGGLAVAEVPAAERGRFSLSDAEVEALARQALVIERHYGQPMDIEWAKDGSDGTIYIVQARPETVQSRPRGRTLEHFQLLETGRLLSSGRSVGQRIGSGTVRVVKDVSEMGRVQPGDVLVTDMTDPDWEPVMNRAAAIVTNRGGRTCHAAIIARELGIPAVVGTGDGTSVLADDNEVTVSCAEGDDGKVYQGRLKYEVRQVQLDTMPELPTKIMMNVASPQRAFAFAATPNAGVGLARLEFIINNTIGVHPNALLDYPNLPEDLRSAIEGRIAGYEGPSEFFVEKLVEGIATIAAAFQPKPVIVRLSDFKSNEYAHLLGGDRYEPIEENPMIGFRGASRYRAESFRECFRLECRALRKVRSDMGLTNVEVMVPFVRTVAEAREIVGLLAQEGLERGRDGLRLIMMCEVPANAILAEQFLEHFDGFSIGSNDLTQLVLALDRDSGLVASLFSELDPAVKTLMSQAIRTCKAQGKYVGICGQGPSDYPDFAEWLLEEGIDSISLTPDTVLETWLYLARHQQRLE